MGVSRCRLAALAALFALYLAAAILLSSVALHDTTPSSGSANNNKASGVGGVGLGLRLDKFAGRSRRGRPRWCGELSYVQPPRPPTALASFPGSGNTWVRYLLQQVTGLHTGSVYKDFGLLKNGFPAEYVTNGSVLVVKTHEWGPLARTPFSQAVLLVRNPERSIQAEFNRQSGGHIGFASPDRYRRAKGKYWQRFVAEKLLAWRQTNFDWLFNFTGPIHVVFYDDLVNDLEPTLKSLMKFLDIRINEGLLRCTIERKEGIYRRKSRFLSFDPFTDSMRRALKIEEERVYKAIRRVQSSVGPQLTAPNR